MTKAKRDRPAWPLFLVILLLGICFMLAAGQVAIQLVPNWSLIADVDSKINPNDQLAAWNGSARIEPVSANILTQPAWRANYLTPGASIFVPPIFPGIPTSTPGANNTPPATQGPGVSVTPGQPTAANSSTPIIIIIPSRTSVPPTHIPPAPTAVPTATTTGTSTVTATATSTVMAINTATPTTTVTATSTVTLTSAPVMTNTETPTATATDALPACKTTIDLNTAPNPHPVSNDMTCFTYTNTDPLYNNGAVFQILSTGAQGNLHDGCGTEGLIPGSSIDYGVWDSGPIDPGGVMIFRINVTTAGSLDVAITPWSGSLPCP